MHFARPQVALLALLAACGGGGSSAPPDGGAPPDLAGAADQAGPTATVVRVHYPAGSHAIAIRGSGGPLSWDLGVAMTSGGNDTFEWSSTAVQAPLEWKPLVDDKDWSRGPNYTVQPGQTVDVWPHFYTVTGKVVKLIDSFHSTKLPDDRGIWAYLPPSYDENTDARFPVVYMHDGQNLFDPSLAFGGVEWKVDETMDGAAEDGSIREAIVIGIENTAARIYEYTPTRDASVGDGGGGDLYLSLVADELKPKVDQMLRTMPERENTTMIGSSLGGLISAWAGLTRSETFGRLGVMSPSTWWDNDMIITSVAQSKATHAIELYVDSGDSGTDNDDVTLTSQLADTYRQIGYSDGKDLLHVVQAGGQHNELYWSERLPGALQFLIGPR